MIPSVIIGRVRGSSASRIKWIFRFTAMPVLKNLTRVRCIHGASCVDALELPLRFSAKMSSVTAASTRVVEQRVELSFTDLASLEGLIRI